MKCRLLPRGKSWQNGFLELHNAAGGLLAHGDLIPIEERGPAEVLGLQVGGEPVAPAGARARNPAFDVTPFRYLTGIVTENGVVRPPYRANLARAVRGQL